MTDNDYLGKDKFLHFIICFVTALINPFLAAGLAIGKEYGDYKSSANHWCWFDLIADALGTILGAIVRYYIINQYNL